MRQLHKENRENEEKIELERKTIQEKIFESSLKLNTKNENSNVNIVKQNDHNNSIPS